MEFIGSDRAQTISFAVRIAVLMTVTVGLATQTFMSAEATGRIADEPARKLLARIGWLSVAMLGLTLVLLFWTVVRYFRRRLPPGVGHQRTPYVDAWSLAGKRFQLDDSEDDQAEPEQDD